MAKAISLQEEAEVSVRAMVAKAKSEPRATKEGQLSNHPVQVWEYVLKCVENYGKEMDSNKKQPKECRVQF